MKKLALLLGFVVAASVSQAEYLMWQVSDATADQWVTPFGEYGYATIMASTDGGQTWSQQNVYFNDDSVSGVALKMDSPAAIDLSVLGDNASYYIEVFRYDTTAGQAVSMAKSEELTYANIPNGYVTSSLTKIPQAWTGGTYTATPEPTSAMLMMLGFALISLKRKKM